MRDPKDTLWWRIINLQPATWRALVVAVVAFLGALGIVVKPEIPDSLLLVVAGLLPIIQGLWTKSAVTPNAKVAVRVPEPVIAPNVIEPGPASVVATDEALQLAASAEGE